MCRYVLEGILVSFQRSLAVGLNAVRTSVLITVDKDKVRMYGFCATVDKRNRQIVDCTLVLENKFLGVSYSGR